ncbi:hypothetical protein IBF22_09200, partial [Francisella tularensis]|nr:hypothetical protein [Francisella tularensis]
NQYWHTSVTAHTILRVGAVQALNKEASTKVARFSLKILYGAVLVSILSACVVGFIV